MAESLERTEIFPGLNKWDTDVHSTSLSEGSTFVADHHGRCLRRALDQKVRKLRDMMTADEDITTEMDRVICRLMKLALRSSRGRQNPPPTRWMQCKLLDLLTLTEKAIERRKRHFIETYPFKAIGYVEEKPVEMIALKKIREDDTGTNLVDKYRHLLRPSDKKLDGALPGPQYKELDLEDDFVSITSNEFIKDFDYLDRQSPAPVKINLNKYPVVLGKEETPFERTRAWVDEDIEIVPYPSHDVNFDNASSGDTDHSTHDSKHKQKKSKKYKITAKNTDETMKACKRSHSRTTHDKKKNKQDSHKRKSSTRITENVTRKVSNGLVKNSSSKCVAKEYGNYVLNSTRKNIENQHLLAATKPIPESITELCPPKIDSDNMEEFKASASDATDLTNGTVTLHQTNDNIAATKESLLIDIIMDGHEETIAMRRTVGTDAENDPMDFENETVIGSVSNELYTKHNVSTENVLSQTIFLNDINEPSTSKGIRHVSMDVQCGPDVTPSYSALSASPSLAKMPDMSAMGAKMTALIADINMRSTDFGTSTQNGYYEITPRIRSVGIKIRDSDTNIVAKVEGSTMTRAPPEVQKTVTIADPHVTIIANNFVSPTETKLIKPIWSTLKIDDSGSDFYESVGSFARSPVHFTATSKNPSDVLIESSESKEAGVTTKFKKYVRPTLSRGGVHVHSYRDKQLSEDVLYQGEWQRCRPKVVARRMSYIPTTTRKLLDSALKRKRVNSKEKLAALRKLEKKEVKLDPKKPVPTRILPTRTMPARVVPTRALPTRKPTQNKIKPATKNEIKPVGIPNNATKVSRLPRHVINNVKIATKLTINAMATKNIKFTHIAKKATPIPSSVVKKENDKTQQLKDNYIPLYLKKNKQKLMITNKTSLNKSIDSVNAMIKVNKTKPIPHLVRSKTEEIKKELLKFPDEPRENISFIVFRNDKDDKKDTKEQSTHITDNVKKTGCIIKRIQSFQSPNSSTCSSPNSVATVRAATVKIKNTSTRRHSTSSYKSNTINSESDTSSPTKNKKFAKRSKSAKRADCKDACNKENIPESSPKSKEKESYGKTPFVGRHRNVFIAQLKTESSHLQFTPKTLSKHQTKPQLSNKSNVKIPVQVDTIEKKRAASPSVSRRRSSKLSTSSFEYKHSSPSPERSNMVLVVDRHHPRPVVVKSRNVSPIPTENSVNIVNNNLLTEWMKSSSLIGSNRSNTTQTMQQLIDEMLDFVDGPFDDIDSETVILSRDDGTNDDGTSGNESVDMSASPTSFKTIITNEDANNNLIENDIEEVLNRTLDSMFSEGSTNSLNDTRQTVTDLDFLSIKSVTSASKYSEYFLADNEVNDSKVFAPAPAPAPNSNSVRDIFERKDNNMLQTTAGALAVQAFSGFSLAGDAVAGDQPDPISIIDSETGSVALDVARQATSEELFVSGRSSDSYESCVIDEDAVVPNWLFNIISQQQSVVNNPAPQLPVPIPLPDQMFDNNGNALDQGIVGLSAGAGDGRGMHSDHSQDSSGRGTSLSSSEMSSDPQSEAILIDPSALVNQFELMREPLDNAINVPTTSSDSTVDTYRIDGSDNAMGSSNAGRNIRTLRPPVVVTSDVDADISSIDTDIPDSSDN